MSDDVTAACVWEIGNTLGDREIIVCVRRGVPAFSRNTMIPFLVDIATETGGGDQITKKRGVVVLVESNPPHHATVQSTAPMPPVTWQPL